MEAKKTPRADLQSRRVLFIEIGLLIALLVVVGAFSWSQREKKVAAMTDVTAVVEQEVVINTEQPERPPEIKPQQNQVISDFLEVVTDDTVIDSTIDFSDFSEDITVEPPTVVEEVVDDMPLMNVEEMPQFQGGDIMKFRDWVHGQIVYPRMAVENNIQGKVTIKFVIERDGSLSNIEVLASPDKSLEQEAVRVLKTSPKWTPGRHNGRAARVFYILPVDFVLRN